MGLRESMDQVMLLEAGHGHNVDIRDRHVHRLIIIHQHGA